MKRPLQHPQMRAGGTQSKNNWFRIENAHVDEEGSDKETTKVYIYDSIGDSWFSDSTPASEFIKQIAAIKTPNIELHLNSPGGDIFDGVAIYNALRAHPAQVTVIVDALAASAASFIAQAGDKVVMTKAATMMIHDGSAMAWGPAAVMRETADVLDKLSNTVAEIYSDRAGQSVEFWRNLMIEETWYNSHEAVDAGLADEIGEDTKTEDDEKAQNAWDLSIFNHAGRSNAPSPLEARLRIANRLKETVVAHKPTNTQGEPEKPEESGSPEVNPDANTTQGDAEEVAEAEQEQSQPGAPENPAGETSNSGAAFQPQATASGAFQFKVNGETTSDPQVVQNRLDFLENAHNESIRAGKKAFVAELAKDNKIMASQIPALENYALGLSDEGYDAWRATWDGAAAMPMFQKQPGGVSNEDGPQSQSKEDAADRVNVLRDTVAHHKRTGMTNQQIEETGSYKELVSLDPTFKL